MKLMLHSFKNVLYIFVILTAGWCISGCSNNSNQKSATDKFLDVEIGNKRKTNFETTFSAPSPDEIITLFEDSGLKFKSNLVNDPENINRYLSSATLNMNLGVFVADAAYLNMFKQYAQLTSHLESIFKIVDKLELNSIYLEFDFKKFFREMDNPDSLIVLSEGVYHSAINFMIANEKESELCMISYGSLIELLYLTVQSIDDVEANEVIIQQIYDQQMQLDNLIEFSQNHADNPDVNTIIADLTQIKSILSKSITKTSDTQTDKTSSGELVISGRTYYQVTTEQFNELKSIIIKIRTKITS